MEEAHILAEEMSIEALVCGERFRNGEENHIVYRDVAHAHSFAVCLHSGAESHDLSGIK